MSTLPKEVLRGMITDGILKTPGALHSYLKEIFKDTLQEMLEAELKVELGYSICFNILLVASLTALS